MGTTKKATLYPEGYEFKSKLVQENRVLMNGYRTGSIRVDIPSNSTAKQKEVMDDLLKAIDTVLEYHKL